MQIDKEAFDAYRKELEAFDGRRETLIGDSRKLLSLSKQAMYATHRDEHGRAATILEEASRLAGKLKDSYAADRRDKIGAVTAALQEWGESLAYHHYATEGRVVTKDETGLETEDYLLAVADMTGELTRRAVLATINKDYDKAKEIRHVLDELLGIYLSFNFRNGELRKKTDQVRWNLQKVEELLIKAP